MSAPHTGAEHGTVCDVGCLAERRVGPADVVVVTAAHNGTLQSTGRHGRVERLRNRSAALSIKLKT